MTKPITIALADAQPLVRLGLRRLLEAHKEFQIVGEASTHEELVARPWSHPPDVFILDYHQGDHFSVETIHWINKHLNGAGILIITADNDKKNIFQVLEYGVRSFLTKTCDEEEIIDGVKAAARGEKFFCKKVIDYLLEKSLGKVEEDCAPTPLTAREIEIVQLSARGLIAKEIADRLGLSLHTVYTHRKNILKKLNLNSSSELVLYAINTGIINHS
jgi:DNA-binding NarL/FixJ family response regulator